MKKSYDERIYETQSVFKGEIMITPAKAQEMLEKQHGNRNLKPLVVDALARDMMNGTFQWNHQSMTLAVSPSGNLINGQHRLLAMAKSGTAHMMYLFEENKIEEADEGIFDITQVKSMDFTSILNKREISFVRTLLSVINRRKKYTLTEIEKAWAILLGKKELMIKEKLKPFYNQVGKGFNNDVLVGALFAYLRGVDDVFDIIHEARRKEPLLIKAANLKNRMSNPDCKKWISAKGEPITERFGVTYQMEYYLYFIGENPNRFKEYQKRARFYKEFQQMAYELFDKEFPRVFD